MKEEELVTKNNKTSSDIETQFSMETIKREQRYLRKFVISKLFKKQIKILEKLTELHINLLGYFFIHAKIKRDLGLKYEENVLLNNTLVNHVYLNASILELLKKGYYGSARILLRQCFEMLIIAKYSEYNKKIIKKWKNANRDRIIMRDILNELNKADLSAMWGDLCKFVHATPYAQQFPLFIGLANEDKIPKKEFKEWIKEGDFILNMFHTLDLFFIILNMLFHLDLKMDKKTGRFYLGYPKDPCGDYFKIRNIKARFRGLAKEYFKEMEKYAKKNGIKKIKNTIYEYRLDWKKFK